MCHMIKVEFLFAPSEDDNCIKASKRKAGKDFSYTLSFRCVYMNSHIFSFVDGHNSDNSELRYTI